MKVIQVGNLVDDSNINFKNPQRGRVYSIEGISPTIYCFQGGNLEPKIMEVIPLNPYNDGMARTIKAQYQQSSMANFKRQDGLGATGVLCIPQATKQGYIEVEQGGIFDAAYPESTTRRGRVQEGGKVTPTLCTSNELSVYEGVKNQEYRIRKLTPRECFRLMGVAEENIDKIQAAGISNAQQYKMAGNSIVVDVLYHIFRKMFVEKESDNAELTLF